MLTYLTTLIVFLALLLPGFDSHGQDVAVKTNLISDALLNVNLGAEVSVAPQWTIDVEGQLNFWTLSGGKRWKHYALQPEVRYWLCNRMDGHFFGAHLHGGLYNIGALDGGFMFLGTDFRKLKDYRFQGWFAGAGVSYGYAWVLDYHWNLEAEIGIGWSYTRYDQYKCWSCNRKLKSNHPHNYVGPTRVALNMVYIF